MKINFKKEIKRYIKSVKTKKNNYSWILKITLFSILMSLLFSYSSEKLVSNLNAYIGVSLLILFIFIGIMFDIIGVAITTVSITPFHSMNSKKISSATTAIKLIANAEKVSSFCNDVVGDICGILSGTICVLISAKLSSFFNINIFYTTLILTAFVTGVTIGGKAFGKSIAINKNVFIVYKISRVIDIFKKKETK